MAKCEKCGQEYPDGTEHVCSLAPEVQSQPQEQEAEKKVSSEEPKEVRQEESAPTN